MRLLIIFIMLALTFSMGACDKTPKQQDFNNLFEAAKHGNVVAIEHLISKGSVVNQADKHGRTALAYAVMGHHLDAVKMLIAKGATTKVVTPKGYDLVMLSLYNEMGASLDTLNYLVAMGLSVNHTTAEGDSALNIAISSQHEKAVARLISLGALPNEKSNEILKNQVQPNAAIVKMINTVKR